MCSAQPSSLLTRLLITANHILLTGGFSTHPVTARRVETKDHEPTIFTLPSVLSSDQTDDMLHLVESSIQNGTLMLTNAYQEDVFSRDKWEEEDALLKSIVQPLMDDNTIPQEHIEQLLHADGPSRDSALQMFVYAATKYQRRLSEEDVILGANIIQRRHGIDRWKSEDGLSIMRLSLDEHGHSDTDEVDWDSISLGKRYELPPAVRNELESIVPEVLKGYWTTTDATLVKYSEGDSQVPHIDPCDATLLVCIRSCEEGGDTCFPLLENPLRLQNEAGSGILFFSSQKVALGDSSRDTLSLHHGGKVVKGEKIVVQLMLEYMSNNEASANTVPPDSWLDLIPDQ